MKVTLQLYEQYFGELPGEFPGPYLADHLTGLTH